jgi:hypothetical protein
MNYPAILRESAHRWANAFWIGTKNWTNESGESFPYYVARIGPRDPGMEFITPIDTRIISRTEDTRVFIDGVHVFDNPAEVDEVDPSIAADRMIINRFNVDVGVSVTRKVYAYVNQFHDNYHVIEYEYCNTGNIDGDEEVELAGQTLTETYFFHLHRWRQSGQAAWSGTNGQVWGKYNMIDVVGDGHVEYPVDFTAFYAWAGYERFIRNNLGSPLIHAYPDWHATIDTVGRLAGGTWTGRMQLHIDRSPGDETYVKCVPATFDTCQPHTIGWMDQDEPLAGGEESHEHYYELGILTRERPSRMFPHHADRVDPTGEFWLPKINTGDGTVSLGGHAPTEAVGPYDMAFGDCVYHSVVEAVDGLTYDAEVQIGRAFKRAGATRENRLLDYDANGDGRIETRPFDYSLVGLPLYQGDGCTACTARGSESLTKNQWVMTARDSLFQTFFRARNLYEASNRFTVYPIPEAPHAPTEFTIDGASDAIDLAWVPNTNGPSIDHWEIYRTTSFVDNLLDANGNDRNDTATDVVTKPWGTEQVTGYVKIADVPSGTTRYRDATTNLGTDYFYYLIAVGAQQPDDPKAIRGTPGGSSLQSSRYLTQSYLPANTSVGREGSVEVPATFSIESVYPNPFSSSTVLLLNLREAGRYAVKVYDSIGHVVQKKDFNFSTPGRNYLSLDMRGHASGLYIIQVVQEQSGTAAVRRVISIRRD